MITTIKSGLEFIFSASNTNEKDVNVVSSWLLILPDENVLALSYLSCPLSFKSSKTRQFLCPLLLLIYQLLPGAEELLHVVRCNAV